MCRGRRSAALPSSIAVRSVPERIHRAAWRALNPEDPTLNYVGVLKAA